MFPRSGGEKVYLEAAYQRPRLLATIVFSTQAILLGFTGALFFPSHNFLTAPFYCEYSQSRSKKRPFLPTLTAFYHFIWSIYGLIL